MDRRRASLPPSCFCELCCTFQDFHVLIQIETLHGVRHFPGDIYRAIVSPSSVSIFVSTSVFVSFFKDVMPRGLDSVPATMKLLIGVVVQSLLVLLATLFVMSRDRQQDDVITADAHPPFEGHWVGSEKRNSTRIINSPDVFVLRQESTQRGQATVGDKNSDTKVSPGMSEYTPPIATLLAGGDDRRGCLRMTTRSLDRVLFLLAFTANVMFLCSLSADWL